MRAPINSKKHFVTQTNAIVASGAFLSIEVIKAVVAPATATTIEVLEGSVIKAVHLEYWYRGNDTDGNSSQQSTFVYKAPGGAPLMVLADALNPMSYLNKKNILFTTQGILGDLETVPIPLMRQWIKIPKGKQRFGLGDKLVIATASGGGSFRICGIALYKEYQ